MGLFPGLFGVWGFGKFLGFRLEDLGFGFRVQSLGA